MTDSIAPASTRTTPTGSSGSTPATSSHDEPAAPAAPSKNSQNYEVSQLRPPDPERRPRAAGSYFDRRDPWPIRSGYMIDDPIHDGRF